MSRSPNPGVFLLALAAIAALATPAMAGQQVDLRADALGHRGVVTLGDLFEGAQGAAAAQVVGRAAIGQEAVLDAGDVQLAAHVAGLDWANATGQRRIIVPIAAEQAPGGQSTRHAHRRGRAAQVLVYARNLPVGEIVQASDLQWSDEAVASADAPGDAQSVIGMAARMPLREGAAVAGHDLVAAKVIRRDQMISVDFSDDGVSLSLSAKAMGDAAVGDAVQVMNLSSKKIIQATATSPGHAAVGPSAEAVRASAFQTAAN